MTEPSKLPSTGRAGRLLIAIASASAAAALTAGMTLNQRPASAYAQTAWPAAQSAKRIPTEYAPTVTGSAPMRGDRAAFGSARPDPSLPSASEVLGVAPASDGEAAPTF